jgi:hypothetical protein
MKNYHEDDAIYCPRCMQNRKATDFKIWLSSARKVKQCDRCHDDITQKAICANTVAERKAKEEAKRKEKLTSRRRSASDIKTIDRAAVRMDLEFKKHMMQIERDHAL